MSSKRQVSRLEYRIKLLSGNNVVLVEASGFESEIFVPEILNGRIAFQNIIPERRCDSNCGRNAKKNARQQQAQLPLSTDIANTMYNNNLNSNGLAINFGSSSSGNNNNNHHHDNAKERMPKPTMKSWRSTAGQDEPKHPMVYHSTPLPTRRAGDNKENEPPGYGQNSFATPQAARCAANAKAAVAAGTWSTTVPTPYQVLRDTHVPIPPGIKLVRLYRNPSPTNPKRLSRVVTLNIEDSSEVTERTTEQSPSRKGPPTRGNSPELSSFNLPRTPDLHNSWRRPDADVATPKKNKKTQAPSTKWRKCITPIRTYSRRRAGAGGDQAATTSSPLANTVTTGPTRPSIAHKKSLFSTKVKPTYMVNPTQGTQATHTVRVRKRKLIVDERVELSPHATKSPPPTNNGKSNKRHTNNDDANKSPLSAKSKTGPPKFTLPRTRKSLEQSKMTAFDLLTKPNRSLCMSTKLVQQFRKGCINKAASTYPKYKQLSTIPSIPQNGEIEISSISD